MTLFFIDTSDGAEFVRDELGCEFCDIDAARAAAVSALPEMASDVLLNDTNGTFFAVVRDETGSAVLHASFALSVSSFPREERR